LLGVVRVDGSLRLAFGLCAIDLKRKQALTSKDFIKRETATHLNKNIYKIP
jgi:uncharacterized protein YuzB (UPF0349 family)